MTDQTRFTIGKQSIPLDNRDLSKPSESESAFLKAYDAANSFSNMRNAIQSDLCLSDAGRLVKIRPEVDNLWRTILRSVETVENERIAFENRTKELFAVAPISTPYEIAMDRERRDWFRGLSAEQAANFFNELRSGKQHEEICSSLMRSPVPLGLDTNLKFIKDIHEQNRKALYPAEWALIEYGNNAIDWAKTGMAFVTGISLGLTNKSHGDVLRFALEQRFDLAAKTIGCTADIERINFLIAAKNGDVVAKELAAL